MHSEQGPVWQNPIERTVRTAHPSVIMTVHSLSIQYNTEYRYNLIIFHLTSRQASKLRCCLLKVRDRWVRLKLQKLLKYIHCTGQMSFIIHANCVEALKKMLLMQARITYVFVLVLTNNIITDSTGTGTGTVPGRNNVALVRSRNIFCSSARPCEAFSLDIYRII